MNGLRSNLSHAYTQLVITSSYLFLSNLVLPSEFLSPTGDTPTSSLHPQYLSHQRRPHAEVNQARKYRLLTVLVATTSRDISGYEPIEGGFFSSIFAFVFFTFDHEAGDMRWKRTRR